MIYAVAIEQKDAQDWITAHHRHLKRKVSDRFRVAACDTQGIVGVVQVGRPRSRHINQKTTVEVLRCAVIDDPTRSKNVVSFLLSRAVRAAEALGFVRVITYILECEGGASLRAAGWVVDGATKGGEWGSASRPRLQSEQTGPKTRYIKDIASNAHGVALVARASEGPAKASQLPLFS